jgi:hypothetical protein
MWFFEIFKKIENHSHVPKPIVTRKQVTNLYEHYPSPRVYHVVTADLEFGCAKI